MPLTTPRGGFPYPEGVDNWKQLRAYLRGIAERAAAVSALYFESTAAARGMAGQAGRFHRDTDTGRLTLDTGTAFVGLTTLRIPHTFTLSGEVKVATGDDFYVPPFFVPVPAGQTVSLVAARHRINSGTSATVEVRRNGTLVPGFAPTVTTTTATTDPADVGLADGDALSLVVTAVSGTPKNLSLSLLLDYGV